MKTMLALGIIRAGQKVVLTKQALEIRGGKIDIQQPILDNGDKNQNAPKVDISA